MQNLNHLPPLNHYLSYCALNIMHPQNHAFPRPIMDKQDSRCASIRNASLSFTEEEGNYWFYLQSDEAKALFTTKKDFTLVKSNVMALKQLKSHNKRCSKYVKGLGFTGVNVMQYSAALELLDWPWRKSLCGRRNSYRSYWSRGRRRKRQQTWKCKTRKV